MDNGGAYIYVTGRDLQDLVLNVNEKINEGYAPLGAPQIVVYANTHKSTDNFGIMSTNFRTSYYQFMMKIAPTNKKGNEE